jgi:preprotein translocase subunit SecD
MNRTVIAVVLGLALAGCGNDGTASGPTGGSSSITASQTSDSSPAEIQLREVVSSDPTRAELAGFTCPEGGAAAVEADQGDEACDEHGTKYLLGPAAYAGAVDSASVTTPDNHAAWGVAVDLDAEGTSALTELSTRLPGDGGHVALVIDGVVLSAPGFEGVITTGELWITGGFNEDSANALVDRLS